MKPWPLALPLALSATLLATVPSTSNAQVCPPLVPVEGAAPRSQVFPADNWWNVDISNAPVDPKSASYIAFIRNGSARPLHPEFGGTVSKGSAAVYGYPYSIVNGAQDKLAVKFEYADESDGVNHKTNKSYAFYPIPPEAITEPHWIEGGQAGEKNVGGDRHVIVIDCTNNGLYELYSVWYDLAQQRWKAGSGAYFDMNTNNRRPEGWTSGEASGLQIFPGLVRYDEAWNDAVPDIEHALRVTLRAADGHVFPASHTDPEHTSGALPFGARLRLKMSVNGKNPVYRTSDPHMQKIFRAMQTHGLIFSAMGSDMFVSGTFDVRWNSGILNPAFALLDASDFEVVKLGWQP
jgi:hypothetical protein